MLMVRCQGPNGALDYMYLRLACCCVLLACAFASPSGSQAGSVALAT